jgi:hypothetical protein
VEYECLPQAQIVKLFLLTIFKSCWVGYERWRLLGGLGGQDKREVGEREETLCARVSGRVGGKDGWIRGGECWRKKMETSPPSIFLQHKYAIEGEIAGAKTNRQKPG